MDFILIYCTVPNKKEARKIARYLVEESLVACVNIIDKMQSIFSWDGEICEEKELLLIMKTRAEHFETVKKIIKKIHSYSIPEVISVPIVQASETYLKWIAHETSLDED